MRCETQASEVVTLLSPTNDDILKFLLISSKMRDFWKQVAHEATFYSVRDFRG